MNLSHYGKSITYIALAAVTFLVTALSDNALSGEEILNLVVVVLGAIGVYLVPNFPEGAARFAKTGIAFLTAAVVAALSFWSGGIETTEWLQIIIVAFTAIGVYIVPNGPKEPETLPVEVVSVTPEAQSNLTPAAPTMNITVSQPEDALEVVKDTVDRLVDGNGYHGI